MFKNLFKLRGDLTSQQKIVFGILGFLIFLGIWAITAEIMSVNGLAKLDRDTFKSEITDTKYIEYDSINHVDPDSLIGEHLDMLMVMDKNELKQYGLEKTKTYQKLPHPLGIIPAISVLVNKYDLIGNTWKSVFVNIMSYLVALAIAIPIGFVLGLIPLFRGLFSQLFDAFRFIPLAAVTYIFILWFGIGTDMKVYFLAFGIIVYLIPVVVQRIDEVKDVYLKTVFTLGANTWDTIRTVYIPSVISRLSDDIRVLTAISWTYITVVEMLNQKGGLGGLIYIFRRQSNVEYAFVVLIIIIIIGIFQDYLLRLIDRLLFPYKYVERGRK